MRNSRRRENPFDSEVSGIKVDLGDLEGLEEMLTGFLSEDCGNPNCPVHGGGGKSKTRFNRNSKSVQPICSSLAVANEEHRQLVQEAVDVLTQSHELLETTEGAEKVEVAMNDLRFYANRWADSIVSADTAMQMGTALDNEVSKFEETKTKKRPSKTERSSGFGGILGAVLGSKRRSNPFDNL